MTANVLVIDDEEIVSGMLVELMVSMSHYAVAALSIREALETAISGSFDVIFLDVNLPDGSGLDILPQLRELPSFPEVIIMTGQRDPDGAEIAIRNGAWDYLQKPFSIQQVVLHLTGIMQYRQGLKKRRETRLALKLDGFIGNSPQMVPFLHSMAEAANSDANVLISGETGTGKELCAKNIHTNSARANHSLVVVDCAALPSTLIESILFGYEKGAFTGADQIRNGLVRQADKGTLFLDEIGELGLEHQKAFLRVLQEKQFRAVGSKDEIKSDFRLVAATNRDLDKMAEEGNFRKDLLFRLKAVSIKIPPLRKHPGDIKELVHFYMCKISNRLGLALKGFSPEFSEALLAYSWPGNIRELVNAVESAVSSARFEETLFPRHLPEYIRVDLARKRVCPGTPAGQHPGNMDQENPDQAAGIHLPVYRDFKQAASADADMRYFRDLMASARGDIKEAVRISGLGRSRLYILLKKYNISRFGWPCE